MSSLHRLEPHDPLPESERYLLVMRRFAEEAPRTTLTELIIADGHGLPELTIPADQDGRPLDFEAAVRAAQTRADQEGFDRVYAVDRTSGEREREILAHDGDHTVRMEQLVDTDPDQDHPGSDLRDHARQPPDLPS